jgi:predicted nucleic acid-binding Zn ribbon protein
MRQPPNRFIPAKGPPRASSKQRALAQWRGIDLAGTEKARQSSAKAAENLMPKVLAGLRMDRRRGEAEIVRVWNNSLDPTITAHAQPVGINRGTLFVNIDSSVWLDEIVRYRRKEILDRLQNSFGRGVVTRISFRVG